MRFFLTGAILSGCILLIPLFVTPRPATAWPSGAPGGLAGNVEDGDGEPRTCTICHDSFPVNSGPGDVSIDLPDEVEPGDTVSVTVTLTGLQENGLQGFELAVEDAGGDNLVGEFDLAGATDVRFPSGTEETRHEVTHTSTGNQQDSWTVHWLAPEDLSGDVTFYATGNAGNNADGPGGDYIYTTTAILPVTVDVDEEPVDESLALSPVWPNPVRSTARTTLRVGNPGMVTARLLDARGRLVRLLGAGEMAQGDHALQLDVRSLASGSYVIVVDAPGGVLHRTLTVL